MLAKHIVNKYTSDEWLCFFIIMAGNSWWPIWGNSTFLGTLIYFIATFVLSIRFSKQKRWRTQRILPFILLFSYFVLLDFFKGGIYTSSIFICLSLLIAYHLSNKEAKNVLDILPLFL